MPGWVRRARDKCFCFHWLVLNFIESASNCIDTANSLEMSLSTAVQSLLGKDREGEQSTVAWSNE